MWKLSYINLLKIFFFFFFELFERCTMYDCVPFSCIDSFHMAHNNNLKNNVKFSSWISKKHHWTSIFVEGSYKISPFVFLSVCLSIRPICLSVRPYIFPWIYTVGLFAWGYFAIFTKSDKAGFWKIKFVV